MTRIERAVVLGGSVAGLCAAAAVAPYADMVVVLERDELPAAADHRRGTPQSRHPHFLLNAGRVAIEDLMPGTEAELLAAGVEELDPALAAAYCEPRGWAPRTSGSMTMLFTSRIQLEKTLRDMVGRIGNVDVRQQCDVRGLRFDGGDQERRVVGVDYRDDDHELQLDCDLVVDALGRGSGVSSWVANASGVPVREQTLDAKVMYSSRWYQPPPQRDRTADLWWKQMVVMPSRDAPGPQGSYMSTIFPVEGDRWIAFMGSWGLDMPKDEATFTEHAELVRAPAFGDALAAAEPISEVHTTRSTKNIWRRYDTYDAMPLGLVGVGDAVCAFNPLYGQGMSAAAVTARILRDALAAEAGGTGPLDRAFTRRFAARQAEYLRVPWSLALTRDRGYDFATGSEVAPDGWRKRVAERMSEPAFELVSGASREIPVIGVEFSRVFNIEQSLNAMVRNPRVILGLLTYWLRTKTGRTRLPAPADSTAPPPSEIHLLRRG